ncbi:MAG TPA: hypothetical protein VEZ14_04685 [Dehalococcoidia bacterium]|nr:hypothetical protein [Dehalococcoidia bacterium]
MSREQRRTDRKSQARGGGGGGGPSRRTPVKVGGGSRFPILPVAIAGGIIIVVGVIAYLVSQAGSSVNVSAAQQAASDSSSSIPGTYVAAPAPPQDRAHFPFPFTLTETPMPFCTGVKWSGAPNGQPSPTAAASETATPVPTGSVVAAATDSHGNVPIVTPGAGTCRNSNPPSSGEHLNVQNNVDVGGGNLIKIPPDPDVYPPDVVIPRDAIPHILEHAGVFVGYNCASGDTACADVVKQLTDIVNARINRNDNTSRIVMARDPDLVVGTIGMSSWTRVLDMRYQDFNKKTVDDFLAKNSCRVDFEGFCK